MAKSRLSSLPMLLSLAALGLATVGAVPAFHTPAFAQAAEKAAADPSGREDADVPTEIASEHDDWVVRCKGKGDARICEATQTLQTKDQTGVLASVSVRAQKDKPVYLLVLVPRGVWLPTNVAFKVKDGPDFTLTYKRCGTFCVASLELKPDDITALKASAGSGEMLFETGSRQLVILPLSFKGLGEAMKAALNKE